MKYFDEEDAITEYEKQLQKKDNEIERLKEEYMILQNASDKVEEAKDREIERLNNIINEFNDFIIDVDCHINLGDESEEFILVQIISLEELVYNQDGIEFVFKDEFGIINTLPYKDFLFYQNDYELVVVVGSDKE